MNIPFYKDKVFIFGNRTVAPNSLSIVVINDTTISVKYDNNTGIYLGGVALPSEMPVSNLKRKDGSGYESVEILFDEMGDFFIHSTSAGEGGSGGADLKSFMVEITRPANTTAYTAGDIVGEVTGVLKTILNVAKAAGKGVRIYRVRIQTNDTGVQSGHRFNVHIYNDAPTTTGLVDNGPFSINYANAIKRVGRIPITMEGQVGSNDYNVTGLNPVGTDVHIILEAVTGFTPSAVSTKFTVKIDCELSNN